MSTIVVDVYIQPSRKVIKSRNAPHIPQSNPLPDIADRKAGSSANGQSSQCVVLVLLNWCAQRGTVFLGIFGAYFSRPPKCVHVLFFQPWHNTMSGLYTAQAELVFFVFTLLQSRAPRRHSITASQSHSPTVRTGTRRGGDRSTGAERGCVPICVMGTSRSMVRGPAPTRKQCRPRRPAGRHGVETHVLQT